MREKKRNVKIITLFAVTLIALTACSSDKSDWKKIKQPGSIAEYEDFIKKYPVSEFVDSANYFIEELYFCDCQIANTDSVYKNFINLYPQSRFLDSVNVLIEKLDFDKTLRSNTIADYISFIKRYPESRFLDSIRIIDEAQIASFKNSYEKNYRVVYSKSTKSSNNLTASLSIPLGAKIGGGIVIGGSEGIRAEKEFSETSIEEIIAEYVEFAPFIAVYISKNSVLLSGEKGASFKRLPDKKISISEGSLYELTINKQE